MEKEIRMLQQAPGPGVSCWKHEDQLQELRAQITGPEDTPYADGVFLLSLSIPERYPFEPPHVRFLTPVYHPNIDSDGRICLDTLKMQPQGTWAPAVNINTLLLTIRVLLAYPNPADGLVADITEQYKRDLDSFRADARKWTLRHACVGDETVITDEKSADTEAPLAETNSAESDVARDSDNSLTKTEKEDGNKEEREERAEEEVCAGGNVTDERKKVTPREFEESNNSDSDSDSDSDLDSDSDSSCVGRSNDNHHSIRSVPGTAPVAKRRRL